MRTQEEVNADCLAEYKADLYAKLRRQQAYIDVLNTELFQLIGYVGQVRDKGCRQQAKRAAAAADSARRRYYDQTCPLPPEAVKAGVLN